MGSVLDFKANLARLLRSFDLFPEREVRLHAKRSFCVPPEPRIPRDKMGEKVSAKPLGRVYSPPYTHFDTFRPESPYFAIKIKAG